MVSADHDDHSGHRCPTGVRAVEIYLKLFLTFATHYAKILMVHYCRMWISTCRMRLQYFLTKTTAYMSSMMIAFIDKIDELYAKWVALMAMSQANLPKLATITASIANRAEFSKLPYQLLSEKNSRTSCSRLEQLPMLNVQPVEFGERHVGDVHFFRLQVWKTEIEQLRPAFDPKNLTIFVKAAQQYWLAVRRPDPKPTPML
ncbi:hypothetical protein Tsp_08051 [Trichinella spiralis]|uniref:hypothetical protein n=1 Tax=Trichinella spiralis TaxID=6334 RepID=UPI0001EFDF1D|nr:hypothetical protein Tsp_08051 [Trichinella spiralis]